MNSHYNTTNNDSSDITIDSIQDDWKTAERIYIFPIPVNGVFKPVKESKFQPPYPLSDPIPIPKPNYA